MDLHIEYTDSGHLVGSVFSSSEEECDGIANEVNMKCTIYENETMTLNKNNKFYIQWDHNETIELISKFKLIKYYKYINCFNFNYELCDERATAPKKAYASDSGYDLSLIDVHKKINDITFYKTGVKVSPPNGYYFDLVARSSITKTGYILVNSVGIIDQSYRGEILVALKKIDNSFPDITLPCKLVQLIPRQWIHFEPIQCDNIDSTERGEGGFGSTNKS